MSHRHPPAAPTHPFHTTPEAGSSTRASRAVAGNDSPVSPPYEHPATDIRGGAGSWTTFAGQVLLRKEVIQPHLPVRLPCYDFVPIASPTFDGSLPTG